MSRAGKFIPGGAGRGEGNSIARSGPIRAPEPTAPGAESTSTPGATGGTGGGAKKSLIRNAGSSLVKPVGKNQRLPIIIMTVVGYTLLMVFALYYVFVVPLKSEAASLKQQRDNAMDDKEKIQADLKAKEAALAAQQVQVQHAVLNVDSLPAHASVSVQGKILTTPATFSDLLPGAATVVIHADGYDDYKKDVTLTADKPVDLGRVELKSQVGSLVINGAQAGLTYTLTTRHNGEPVTSSGQLPAKLDNLIPGDYTIQPSLGDWALPPISLTIHANETVQEEVKVPYATVTITSSPAGAIVRNGRVVIGKTPLTLSQQRPGQMHLSLDLPPYSLERVTIDLPNFGNITKSVTLTQDKDFIAACGMPMVWIPDGGFWAGKYHVTQDVFESVAGFNPSFFHKPKRPVEQVSWETAMAFCEKLTQFERKAGKLPDGFKYTLPTESQWTLFSADADLALSPMSRNGTLSSTQDVGASEPNKYGLYDTLGNVWEWCVDNFDDQGNHSLRGGSWLSSAENFPGTETRNAGGIKYADRFTGFRVVLVRQ